MLLLVSLCSESRKVLIFKSKIIIIMPLSMSTRCKWISCGGVSVTVIVVLLFFYRLESRYNKCPNRGELLEEGSGRCFQRGSQGPCHNNLVFLEEDHGGSPLGSCSCDYLEFSRTILFHEGWCYHVFTQAYCPLGQWLNVTRKGEPNCEPNPCMTQGMMMMEMGSSSPPWVPIKGGKCVQLGQSTEGCPPGSVVRFHRGHILPSCHTPVELKTGKGAIGVGATRCPAGSHRSYTGKCQPVFNLDDFDY